ncbi:MAG: hypothetical protein H5T86_14165 [Armatimonadetes bacterium]|nr:hypothetical protein [Armatimonadota bacterium]
MNYRGRYRVFELAKIRTYPISQRPNALTLDGLVWPDKVRMQKTTVRDDVEHVAEHIVAAREAGRHVFFMTGAHIIKLGYSPLVIDLIERDVITLLATQGAGVIHDFELALIGGTSENVPRALPQGLFGMAEETGAYINAALAEGHRMEIGYGEAIARMVLGELMPTPGPFAHPELSIIATAYRRGIPVTVHATIGTDIIDQHPSFDGAAKGACSGRDFLIFAAHVCDLTGGVVLNVGSAVTLPEVLLKSVSMAANAGCPPNGLITADFDIRPADPEKERDPSTPDYYFRDLKSVVVRIPRAFGGHGHYVRGNFMETFIQLWHALDRRLPSG